MGPVGSTPTAPTLSAEIAQLVEHSHGKGKVTGSSLVLGSMAKKKPFIKLQCDVCKRINYFTHKSKKMVEEKLDLKKFCKWCRKHTVHKEGKK